ncbi:phage major capsid protein [Zhenhengia yiwuensis]|uniref:Phage major capsid protein n=1 Tax=Zhenhengia yiwuensis TaxID=2763666 RepID=A0A926ENN7_9FIRM|nr:phage major capsid protein [Zhenhengia yiwuensis]MBC8581622.1 phage major capsid protein [Zhenhengia yiwuensis]MBS5801032.1 phage major capsid protein [Clostridiales bacterium]
MKQLLEKRSKLIEQIEAIMNVAETEKRAFSKEELDKINGYTDEVNQIDATIQTQKEARALMTTIKESATETRQNEPSLLDEIRALQADANKEIEIGTREVRDGTHTFSDTAVGSGNAPTEIISKTTFADYILDKLAYISPLYGAVRHERFGNSKHQIPVQANKLGKFVPMKELAEYTKQVATFEPIKLEAHKFETLIIFSQEAIEDTGYNVDGELMRQLVESYGLTLDELIVKGNEEYKVNDLNDFSADDGTKELQLPAKLTPETLTEMYFVLPIRYRHTATWVISDQTAKALTDMKFEDGRPVIINEHVAELNETGLAIFFGDLKRALIVGERKALSLQKSTEYGFIRDEIAIKANMRLDIKKALGEAVVIGTSSDTSRSKAKAA